MLPEHLLLYLKERILCRDAQIQQLAGILDTDIPSLPTIIVHGTKATGKSLTITEVLQALDVPHAIVKSRECITGRHLLERTVLACKQEVEKHGTIAFNDIDGRCENLSSLAVLLGRLLEHTAKFVLVFDGIDKQREAPPTLLQALARLGDIIPSLTTTLILTYPRPGSFSKPGIPHIRFPPYTRSEALAVVALNSPPIFTLAQVAAMPPNRRLETEEDNPWLWTRFSAAVWDSLGKTAARDVVTFRSVCIKLWEPFVAHVRDGSYGTRDFSRLMVRTRSLFQREDVLVGGLLAAPTNASAAVITNTDPFALAPKKRPAAQAMELPYYTRYLLLAAYLASHNPPRTDQTFFSKASEKKKKRKKKSGAPATPGGGGGAGRPQKHRKLSRRLLGPQPFGLERWLAIFHAIVPDGAPGGSGDILTLVASLGALRMVVKSGGGSAAGAGGQGGGDIGGEGGRWRINVGWEFILGVAKTVRFDVEEFLVE